LKALLTEPAENCPYLL